MQPPSSAYALLGNGYFCLFATPAQLGGGVGDERDKIQLEALDRQDEEQQGKVDEGGPIEEQVNEREVQVTSEEEEEKIRKQLTPGELITMHKDGRCTVKPVQSRSCPRW